jgi:hypothetical protein
MDMTSEWRSLVGFLGGVFAGKGGAAVTSDAEQLRHARDIVEAAMRCDSQRDNAG